MADSTIKHNSAESGVHPTEDEYVATAHHTFTPGDDVLDTDNHSDGSTNGVYTLAERTKLATIAASADVTANNAPKAHKSSHTDGSDDIQSATAVQKGLATATQITKLDAIATEANKYVHPNHSGDVTSVADGAQSITNKQTATLTAPLTSTQTLTVIAAAAPTISMPAATAVQNGYATSTQITKLDGLGSGAIANPLATDSLWDAKGDIAVGTGSNTAGKLAIGTDGQLPYVATDTLAYTSLGGVLLAANTATTPEKRQAVAGASSGRQCDNTDDYVQFNALYTNAGDYVQMTTGTFTLGATGIIVNNSGQRLVGKGTQTILTTGSAITMITSTDASSPHIGFYFGHFNMQGADTATVGIFTNNMGRGTIDYVRFHDFTLWGLHVTEASGYGMRIVQPIVMGCGTHGTNPYTGGIKLGSPWGTGSNPDNTPAIQCTIEGGLVEDCHDGIWVCAGVSIRILNTVIEDIDRHGIVIDNQGAGYQIRNLLLDSIYFEATNDATEDGYDIYIKGGDYATHKEVSIRNVYPSSSGPAYFIACDSDVSSAFNYIDFSGQFSIGKGLLLRDSHMTGTISNEVRLGRGGLATMFDAVATTDSVTIISVPANTVFYVPEITLAEGFTATDLTDLRITMGDAGNPDGILETTGNLVSDSEGTVYKTKGAYFTIGELYHAAATDYLIYVTATGANLSTLTAGIVRLKYTWRYV